MTDTTARRRGHGEDAIYFDAAKNRYVGAISLGFGPDGKRIRRKVTGRTKQEVRDKLKAAHAELDRGLHTSATYMVRQAADDWLEGGLPGRSERTRSIYREALMPLLERIGAKPLRELTARDVRAGLETLSGDLSTRYLQIARASLARAIRYAEAHDLVGRNVATLVDPPKGQAGRPSRSLTLDQSRVLLEAAQESRLYAYVVLSLCVGIRTEEARDLRWDHLDLEGDPGAARPVPPSVAVWRSVRQGGDTKTGQVAAHARAAPDGRSGSQGAPQAASRGPASGRCPLAGPRHRFRLGHRHTAGCGKRETRVPQDHRGGGSGHRLGTARFAPHLRLLDVSRRRPHRGDRPPGRAQPHGHDRTRLQTRAAPGNNHGSRGNGPDPERVATALTAEVSK
jgi:hypothetical protein